MTSRLLSRKSELSLDGTGLRDPEALSSCKDRAEVDRIQRALLNILEDSQEETISLQGAQRAVLNILEDSETERARLQEAQRAVLNILEDFEAEKSKVEVINRQLKGQIEERLRAQDEISRLNRHLEQRVAERTAELAATNKELEAFAYSVSHDLRAPLRHMDGFLALLVKRSGGLSDETGFRYLNKVTAASRTMGCLIDDLLQFARMGRNAIAKTEVNLERMVEGIRLECEAETRGQPVVWAIGPLPLVFADAAMLRLAMVNLVSNALKFSRRRDEVRIEIGCGGGEKDEDVIFVKDNGVGFDPQYTSKLFNVFQRLHSAEEFEGTGVGLANVRRIIERHGGRVWAESAEGAGATFSFSLPGIRSGRP